MVSRKWFGAGIALGTFAVGGIAGAAVSSTLVKGGPNSNAQLSCPGGMARAGHTLNEQSSIFPGDPKTKITLDATVPKNGYQVEKVTVGVHTGTHLDAPGHFIEGGRYVDELAAEEFVWPVYVIDVRNRMAEPGPDDFQLTVADIDQAVAAQGPIPAGAMVLLRTGFDVKFATKAYFDPAPGFSGEAVQHMVDTYDIGGVGSDTLGPDATSDPDFMATFTILDNDRVALPDVANMSQIKTGDLLIAPAVALENGSGFMVDPLVCKS